MSIWDLRGRDFFFFGGRRREAGRLGKRFRRFIGKYRGS